MPATCTTGDGRPAKAKGLCGTCYQRDRRKALDPTKVRAPRDQDVSELLAPLGVDPATRASMEGAAKLRGMTLAAWRREAYHAHLLRVPREHRRKLLAALE